jgi:hypothetical protein
MASGDGLGLFFNRNMIPCGPPAAPPPEIGSTPTPATVLQGTKGQGTYQNAPVGAPAGLQVGDWMVAFVGCYNELGQPPPSTMAGQMPARARSRRPR